MSDSISLTTGIEFMEYIKVVGDLGLGLSRLTDFVFRWCKEGRNINWRILL